MVRPDGYVFFWNIAYAHSTLNYKTRNVVLVNLNNNYIDSLFIILLFLQIKKQLQHFK